MFLLATEARSIRSDVESGQNYYLYRQYVQEREHVQGELEMSLLEQWNQFVRMKSTMLQRR